MQKGQLAVLTLGDGVVINSNGQASTILVAGAPINEPVVQYGPFVMNTEAEINQAMLDYRNGTLA